jgi:hypothetical protein
MILLPSLYREKDKDQVMTTITEMISELLELGTIKPEGEHPNRYMCICGAQFQRLSLRTHLRSKRHIKCMEAKESGDAGSGEERECNICCLQQSAFFKCPMCSNSHCVQCHLQIIDRNPVCPFCRHVFKEEGENHRFRKEVYERLCLSNPFWDCFYFYKFLKENHSILMRESLGDIRQYIVDFFIPYRDHEPLVMHMLVEVGLISGHDFLSWVVPRIYPEVS